MNANIGINEEQRKFISKGLSHLLSDSYILAVKTQHFHWNVTGPQFQALHALFEAQYNELNDAIDVIAERIRALGFFAPGSLSQFAELASIKEQTHVPTANEMLQELAHDHEALTQTAHKAFRAISEAHDEATADLLTQRMQVHEKAAWMLKASQE